MISACGAASWTSSAPLYDHPLRVEFFGDTIDSLRFFSADNQRRLGELEEAVVSPAREAILPGDRLPEIISRIRLQANDQQLPKHEARRLISGIKEEKRFPGIESLLPLISPKLDTLLAYLPSNALMVEVEPADIENAAIEVFERAAQHYEAARAEQKLCIDPDRLFLSWPEACSVLNDRQRLCLRQLPVGPPDLSGDRRTPSLSYAVQDITPLSQVAPTKSSREERSPFQALSAWITDQMAQGLAVHLVCRNANQMERVAGVLEPYGIVFKRGTDRNRRAGDEPPTRSAAGGPVVGWICLVRGRGGHPHRCGHLWCAALTPGEAPPTGRQADHHLRRSSPGGSRGAF